MIFDHIVKHNGIRYEAGQDVPIENNIKPTQKNEQPTATPVEKITEDTVMKRRGRTPQKRD